jgi:hypothetical protein
MQRRKICEKLKASGENEQLIFRRSLSFLPFSIELPKLFLLQNGREKINL